ncbi:MAG TPA: hypothetical protein VGB55_07660 [Tepidisphaeraceae bacterium]|jgi:hypothetical protein
MAFRKALTWRQCCIFPVGTKPSEGGLFSDDWFPIQVKQTDKVGRPDTDAFEAVMEREGEGGRQRGFFVSFGSRLRRRTGMRRLPQTHRPNHQAPDRAGDFG